MKIYCLVAAMLIASCMPSGRPSSGQHGAAELLREPIAPLDVPRSIDGAGRWRAAAYSHEGASPVVGGPPGPSAGSRRGGLWRRKLSAGFSRTFVFFFDLLLLWFCTVPRRDPSKTGKDGHGQ